MSDSDSFVFLFPFSGAGVFAALFSSFFFVLSFCFSFFDFSLQNPKKATMQGTSMRRSWAGAPLPKELRPYHGYSMTLTEYLSNPLYLLM